MSELMSIESAVDDEADDGSVEFRSRYFGRRITSLLIVRTFAIWIALVMLFLMAYTPVAQHGQPWKERDVILLSLAAVAAVLFQYLAYRDWSPVVRQRVRFSAAESTLILQHFRVFRGAVTFGRVEPECVLPLAEITSARIDKGRGRFLRIHTPALFVSISNDIERFNELCDIVCERHC